MDYSNSFIQNLSNNIGEIVPGALGALLVLVIGFILAGIVKNIITRLFKASKIDEKIKGNLKIGKTFGQIAYYLVVIYTLLLVLSLMGVQNVLEPLQSMLNEFSGFLPNLLAGIIIAYAGYVIAKLASEAVGIVSGTIESFSDKAGLTSSIDLTNVIKQVVFLFVFIPLLIVALDSLQMKALSVPASDMLASFLSAIPQIFSAALIISIFFIGGKYITGALRELLKNLGTDNLSKRLKLNSVIGEDTSLSNTITNVAFFFIMFAGIISAVEKLEMESISILLAQILSLSGQIVFGLLILVLGNYIATLVAETLNKSDENKWLATVARFAILGIFIAIGLHTMGIADDIVNLAFGLILGALAVAFALSFGLGGREAAGKHMDHYLRKLRNNKNDQQI